VVTVNYRFAPDRDVAAAEQHVRDVFDGWTSRSSDFAPGAGRGWTRGRPRPRHGGGRRAAGQARLDRCRPVRGARDPAVNYGPGISELAHTQDEYVEIPKILACEERMRGWLTSP